MARGSDGSKSSQGEAQHEAEELKKTHDLDDALQRELLFLYVKRNESFLERLCVAQQSKMRGYGDVKKNEGIPRTRQNIRLCERLVTLLARKSEMSSEVFQRKRQEGCRVHCA